MQFKPWLILLAALSLSSSALADEAPKKKGYWTASATTTVDASAEQVMRLAGDLTKWKEWTAWSADRDPTGRWEYTGNANTVGHSMSWDGPELGKGRLVLTKAEPSQIEYDFFFGNSKKANFGRLSVSGEGPVTVTWYDDGKAKLFKKKISEMVTKDLEVGLGKLKVQAETLALHERHIAKVATAEAELKALQAAAEAAGKASTEAGAAATAARAAADAAKTAAKKPAQKKAADELSAAADAKKLEADKAAAAATEAAAKAAAKAAELETLKAAGK